MVFLKCVCARLYVCQFLFCLIFCIYFQLKQRIAAERRKIMRNHTKVTEFILLGLTDDPKWQVVLFIFLLVTYMCSVTGNLVIIFLTLTDPHLKTPMYFFLRNFSFLEMSFTSATIPRFLVTVVTGDRTISYNDCLAQVFFVILLGVTEFYLLTATWPSANLCIT